MSRNTFLNIGQGESFRKLIVLSLVEGGIQSFVNITDYEFSGSIRETYSSEDAAATFTVEKVTPYESGSLYIILDPSQTRTLDVQDYVYDVIMTSGSNYVERILEGTCIIRPSVTR